MLLYVYVFSMLGKLCFLCFLSAEIGQIVCAVARRRKAGCRLSPAPLSTDATATATSFEAELGRTTKLRSPSENPPAHLP